MSQCRKCHSIPAPVFQKVDSAIYWINHYPVDNAFGLRIIYPLDSDLYNEALSIFWTTGAKCSSALILSLTSAHLDKLLSPVFPPQNCWARSSEIGLKCRWKTRNETLKEGKVTFFIINLPSFFFHWIKSVSLSYKPS